jgi:hypothetical protein
MGYSHFDESYVAIDLNLLYYFWVKQNPCLTLVGGTGLDILRRISNISPTNITNITKITKYYHLDIWSQADCINLMKWHCSCEHHFKRGINNNISLINYSISVGDKSYSLLNYRFDSFIPALMVVLPFTAYKDVRGIIRMSTTFRTIRDDSRWFNKSGSDIIGDERNYIISMLCNRIVNGFSWSGNSTNYLIRRYRLNAICSNPNMILDRNIDVHHKSGLQGILAVTDDRFTNLAAMNRDNHFKLHLDNGDMGFIDM